MFPHFGNMLLMFDLKPVLPCFFACRRASELKNKVKYKKITEGKPYGPGKNMLRLKAQGFTLGKSPPLNLSAPLSPIDLNSGPEQSKPEAASKRKAAQSLKSTVKRGRKEESTDVREIGQEVSDSARKKALAEVEKGRKAAREQTPLPEGIDKQVETSKKRKNKTDQKSDKKTEKQASERDKSSSATASSSSSGDESGGDGSGDESDDSDADEVASSREKRFRRPSSKVVENKELALKAAEKKSKKSEPRMSKQAKEDKRRLDSRALKDHAVAGIFQSLGMDAPKR
jgi:hypothetical protein